MKRFAALLEQLSVQSRDAARVPLLLQYLREAPDPDRGWALALLTGEVTLRLTTPARLRALAETRIDAQLFALSQDYVGELAETVALTWPEPADPAPPALGALLEELRDLDRGAAPAALAGWLDRLGVSERWALLKLAGGRLSSGVDGALARQAVAALAGRPLPEVEAVWHGEAPPYARLLAWAEGRGAPPQPPAHGFRPFMLARALDAAPMMSDAAAYAAEWLWTGVRAQFSTDGGRIALYDRAGDDITALCPALRVDGACQVTLDGQLLALREGMADALESVPRRPSEGLLLRLHDILALDGEDLRPRPFAERRRRLESWFRTARTDGMDLSPLLDSGTWPALDARRRAASGPARGIVLKRWDGPYTPGRASGQWLKWACDPGAIDAVLMYARPAGGAGPCSELTVGLWRDGTLVPVGQADAGPLTVELDAWLRAHTTRRHGPVREVAPELVLQVAFDGVRRAPRRKAGLELWRARIVRCRDDKSPEAADQLWHLQALLPHSNISG